MDGMVVEIRQPDRRPLQVLVRDHLEVGRECDGLLLGDGEVSRRHARLEVVDGRLQVVDLGSSNGTLVNGNRINGAVVLGPGDVVLLGATELALVGGPPPAAPAPASATGAARGTVLRQDSASPPVADPTAVTVARPAASSEARTTSILRVAASVQEEQPPMRATAGGDTITIVFSDIESSTEHALRLGDGQWFEVLGTHNRIVRTNLRSFGGTEIKSQGDGFMLTFPSARRAVQFCISVQQELDRWARDNPEDAVRIRMGAHTGEAIVDDDVDLFG